MSPAPRWATPRDPAAPTFGPAVGKLGAALGMPLMPWQRHVADTALEIDPRTGTYRYSTVVVTVQRQSGKTSLLRPVVMHRCLTTPRASTWLTAQHRNDARDTWEATVEVVESSPLGQLVTVRRTNGGEALIVKSNRARFRVFAPTESALHGKTTHFVGVDEAWAFSDDQGEALTQAIVPTQVTVPGAQVWIVSTAGTSRSAWLRAMVDDHRARIDAGEPSRSVAYFEWCIPPDVDNPADLDVIAAAHPALGHTITRESLERARDAMGSPAAFARAYGNYWVSSDSYVIPPAVWDGARTHDPIMGSVALGVEVHADRTGAVIVAAGRTAAGAVALEVIDERGGTAWVAPRVAELAARHRPVAVVIDPYGPARSVHTALTEQRRGRPVRLHDDFGASDFVMSCGELVDGLVDGTVQHRSHPALDSAMQATVPRTVREQQAFSRAMTVDGKSPAALLAAALALYGHRHPPATAPPPRIHAVGTA